MKNFPLSPDLNHSSFSSKSPSSCRCLPAYQVALPPVYEPPSTTGRLQRALPGALSSPGRPPPHSPLHRAALQWRSARPRGGAVLPLWGGAGRALPGGGDSAETAAVQRPSGLRVGSVFAECHRGVPPPAACPQAAGRHRRQHVGGGAEEAVLQSEPGEAPPPAPSLSRRYPSALVAPWASFPPSLPASPLSG